MCRRSRAFTWHHQTWRSTNGTRVVPIQVFPDGFRPEFWSTCLSISQQPLDGFQFWLRHSKDEGRLQILNPITSRSDHPIQSYETLKSFLSMNLRFKVLQLGKEWSDLVGIQLGICGGPSAFQRYLDIRDRAVWLGVMGKWVTACH